MPLCPIDEENPTASSTAPPPMTSMHDLLQMPFLSIDSKTELTALRSFLESSPPGKTRTSPQTRSSRPRQASNTSINSGFVSARPFVKNSKNTNWLKFFNQRINLVTYVEGTLRKSQAVRPFNGKRSIDGIDHGCPPLSSIVGDQSSQSVSTFDAIANA